MTTLSKNKKNISDYSDYDYKKEFWENVDRKYEDLIERKTLTYLLNYTQKKSDSFLDAGCGFGRLFNTYKNFSNEFFLLDYAQHLLDEAKNTIQTDKKIHFIQGSFFEMPFDDCKMDTIISLRTLHHVESPELFLNELSRVLKPGGHIIFEIPNKRHLINIARYFLGKLSNSPFNKEPLKLNKTFFNHNFTVIKTILSDNNFTIIKTIDTSFFRSSLIKKIVPASLLVSLDTLFQKLFSWTHLTPSIFVLCQKK